MEEHEDHSFEKKVPTNAVCRTVNDFTGASDNTKKNSYQLLELLYHLREKMVDSAGVGQMENSSAWQKCSGDHPLQTAWAFWYDKKQLKKTDGTEFRNKLQKIGSFDTVESFWKTYLYLRRPSTLEMNVNLYLFRDGPNIAPMWEAFPR